MSRVLFNRITEKQWEQHEEAAVSYADLKASVDQYYDENITQRDQTDKLVEASMSSLNRNDPAINQKLNEATETFARISSNVTEVLSLVKGFDFSALLSVVKSLRDHATALKREFSSLRKDTSEIKSMMTEMYAAFQGHPSSAPSGSVTPTLALTDIQSNIEGENANTTDTEEPPSHTEGETEELRLAILISSILSTVILPTQAQPITSIIIHSESSQANPKIDKGKGIATESSDDPSKKLVKASRPNPDEPIRKAEEEARLLAITKPEVIKVVQEEAEKIGLDPKAIKRAKAGEMFKKSQYAKHDVLKRQHTEKVRKSLELRKHKFDNYKWTVSSRLKPEPITDIKIYPKTKPVVITVYRGTDGRNFEVHEPFLFGAFGISELDELREIIPKKKNAVVKELMKSLSQRYERLKKIPEELGIHFALHALAPE
ncbi:hypothetical protein Tco_0393099 [Tanacetum coccineum]